MLCLTAFSSSSSTTNQSLEMTARVGVDGLLIVTTTGGAFKGLTGVTRSVEVVVVVVVVVVGVVVVGTSSVVVVMTGSVGCDALASVVNGFVGVAGGVRSSSRTHSPAIAARVGVDGLLSACITPL